MAHVLTQEQRDALAAHGISPEQVAAVQAAGEAAGLAPASIIALIVQFGPVALQIIQRLLAHRKHVQ